MYNIPNHRKIDFPQRNYYVDRHISYKSNLKFPLQQKYLEEEQRRRFCIYIQLIEKVLSGMA